LQTYGGGLAGRVATGILANKAYAKKMKEVAQPTGEMIEGEIGKSLGVCRPSGPKSVPAAVFAAMMGIPRRKQFIPESRCSY
jgi:hypothetical protein